VLDPSGRLVRMLDNGTREAGAHVLRWNGSDGAGRPSTSGVYYVRLQAGSFARTLPLIVIR
jgi:flagellar hook assembly protein FlgD